MTSQALRLVPGHIRRHPSPRRRTRRLATDTPLLSVAGCVGLPVIDGAGRRVGVLDDLVVRWDAGESHPPVAGAIVRTRRSRSFVPMSAVASLLPDALRLGGNLEHRVPERRPGLVALTHDVLDRQIVDAEGVEVVRVSDVILGRFSEEMRLLGADVSVRTLFRRLGPARLRRRVVPDRVYDWHAVAAFSVHGPGEAGSVLRLTAAANDLRALGASELEALLERLPPHERDQFAAHLGAEPNT